VTITATNGQTFQVKVKGSAVVVAPKLVVFPPNNTVNYGLVATGESVTNNILEISNTGNAPLQLSGFTITGANASEFTILSGGTNQSLAAGAKQKVNILAIRPRS
jgi:hypothetical protein